MFVRHHSRRLLLNREPAENAVMTGPEKQAASGGFSFVRLLPAVIIAGGLILALSLGWHRYLSYETLMDNREWLLSQVEGQGLRAALMFVGIYAVATAFSIPGGLFLTIGGGFLFGTVLGASYVVVGATLGATILFLAARTALGDMLRAKAGPALRKMEAGFHENELSYLLVLRFIPLFPFWLVNLVPAFLGVSLRNYVVGTFFGIIPGTIVYTSVGSGLGAIFDAGETPDLGIIFKPQVLLPIIGLIALSLVPVIYKKFKTGEGVEK
jgi:uncharacterized membrane protein YdjX (TVP38/TMEM64 family)